MSDRAILACGLVTAGSTIGSAVTPTSMGGRDIGVSPRMLIGTGLTFTALSIVGEFAPGLATPIAVAIALTAFMWYGIPVLNKAIGNNTGGNTNAG